MGIRGLTKLVAATAFAMTPILGVSQPGGRGVVISGMPPGMHGPLTLPDAASSMARDRVPGPGVDHGADFAAQARRTHARDLWRSHREQLAFDPQENLIVRGEIVAFAPSAEALAQARAEGFSVRREQMIEGFAVSMITLEPPHRMSASRALRRLRALDPDGAYDFNHIYFESATAATPAVEPASTQANATARAAPRTPPALRIGLVDGAVAAGHPALRSASVHAHGCDGESVPSAHGTAVASLLVDSAAPSTATTAGVELFVADVYCGKPTGGSVDALIDALAWLVNERVAVINVSLVGPSNKLLERAIALAAARGHVVVAAVGNDGPAAAPLYPAAYPDAVAVTGVDRSDRVLLEAGRGGFVDFAAPGSDMLAASLPDGYSQVRGTSFAAPIVAGLLAQRLDHPDRQLADQAVHDLAAAAADLGARGFDPVYGNGLVGRDVKGLATASTQRPD